jgi:hypothetical protein
MTPENIIRMEVESPTLADIHMPCSPCISGDEFAAAAYSNLKLPGH